MKEEEEGSALSSFEDFVETDLEEIPEIEEEIVEEIAEEIAEEEPAPKKQQQLNKAENAIIHAKKDIKTYKDLIKSMSERLESLEKTDTDRGYATKKTQLINEYLQEGYDESKALKMAERDLEFDKLKEEVQKLTKTKEDSVFEIKTHAEKDLLYKQAKAKQSNSNVNSTSAPETIKMSTDQKKDWDAMQKTPWGKTINKKDFIKSWKESFE